MDLGKTILEFRKKLNLSQEELASKVGVTRQTISKWELNETSPTLIQSVELAKIFNISLNDLTNDVLIFKVTENEKSISKISKKIIIICIILVLIFIIEIIAVTFYGLGYYQDKKHGNSSLVIMCTLNNKEYSYAVTYDETGDIIMTDGSPFIHELFIFSDKNTKSKYKKVVPLITDINNYFTEHGGYCE